MTLLFSILAIWKILEENTDKSRKMQYLFIQNASLNFTLEKYMIYYISIKNSAIFYFDTLIWWAKEVDFIFNQVNLIRYFALISLKSNSPSNLTLKDMYNMSYIQTSFFRENINLIDSTLKCVIYISVPICDKFDSMLFYIE